MMRSRSLVALAVLAAASMASLRPALGQEAPALGSLGKLPVREITVFKDGHAFVLHAGTLPTDDKGNVQLHQLPQPVLGSFWPYATEKSPARLSSVSTIQRRVKMERTALTTREMIEANIGAEVIIKELPESAGGLTPAPGAEYAATIVGVPERSGEEMDRVAQPGIGPQLPQKGSVVLLKTAAGTKVLDIARVAQVTFKGPHKTAVSSEELRATMSMKLDWPEDKPQKEAEVGMVYLQKGIRWIPSYRVTIDGKGEATVKLEATLINEMVDLEDVTANLVVGVPSFAFANIKDPIGLEQVAAQLSQHFATDARTAYALTNSIQTQVVSPNGGVPRGVAEAPRMDLGPDVVSTTKNEDLFLFKVNNITLKKGGRLVVTISETKIPYKDVYKLDIPISPPPEVWRSWDPNRQDELARLLAAPKFEHKLNLTNTSSMPLTTAPAIVLQDGKLIAQGMMTYTGLGGTSQLSLTTAVDLKVAKNDKETKRTPRDMNWNGYDYARVDIASSIRATSMLGKPVNIEITRYVLGKIDKAENDADTEGVNLYEDNSFAPKPKVDYSYPAWWGWYGWPGWWSSLNGVSRVTWRGTLEPGKSLEFPYEWHYYWR